MTREASAPNLVKLLAAAGAAAWVLAPAARAADGDSALTIYSSVQPGALAAAYYRPLPGESSPSAADVPGYAMVSQDRKVEVAAGRSQVRFTDVAALIDPTTVQFVSLSDPQNTRVIEQNFQFDLISTSKLLSRYIDKNVTAQQAQGDQVTEITGVLLAAADGHCNIVPLHRDWPPSESGGADLSGANLTEARLSGAVAVGTNFSDATMRNCNITAPM